MIPPRPRVPRTMATAADLGRPRSQMAARRLAGQRPAPRHRRVRVGPPASDRTCRAVSWAAPDGQVELLGGHLGAGVTGTREDIRIWRVGHGDQDVGVLPPEQVQPGRQASSALLGPVGAEQDRCGHRATVATVPRGPADAGAVTQSGRAGSTVPDGDGGDELGVVAFVLVGVAAGEVDHGLGEPVALAEVGVDGHRVAGAGVGPGQASRRRRWRTRPGVGAMSSMVGMIFMSRNWRT